MKQIFHEIVLKTKGTGLYVFTDQTQEFVNNQSAINNLILNAKEKKKN